VAGQAVPEYGDCSGLCATTLIGAGRFQKLKPVIFMSPKDQITAWLKDAHAMEQSLANVLQQHIKDARDLPEIREHLQQHLEETWRHADRIRSSLESLGDSPSAIKSAAGASMGFLQGMATGMFRDELVKNAIADYTMEHFEMACYSALATAADDAGLIEIAQTCREIFGEEAEMADWLEEQIPELTRMHLQQTAASS
jgi:ferritin-like metal-binding protein YciE